MNGFVHQYILNFFPALFFQLAFTHLCKTVKTTVIFSLFDLSTDTVRNWKNSITEIVL